MRVNGVSYFMAYIYEITLHVHVGDVTYYHFRAINILYYFRENIYNIRLDGVLGSGVL